MSALRDEIRAILREEFAVLRSESTPVSETVRITSSGDLNRFAQDLLARVSEPDFAQKVKSGQIAFTLAGKPEAQHYNARPIVSSPTKPANAVLNKALITERDIAELGATSRVLRLAHQSRLTPLAKDEAQRKGIRIERIEA